MIHKSVDFIFYGAVAAKWSNPPERVQNH